LNFSSLVLAALSPMLAGALQGREAEDPATILIPEGLTADDVALFLDAVFDWNLSESVALDSILRVFQLFDLESHFNLRSQSVTSSMASASSAPCDDPKRFKCDECDARFSALKLKKRHARTAHSEHHPHVCQLCGRRCRGPAGIAPVLDHGRPIEQVCFHWSSKSCWGKHLVKNWLISSLDMVIYFKGTIFHGGYKS
jgi:hypothetical protein